MTVFKSQLEQLMPAEELLFDPTSGFGKYKRFLEPAIAHPAKMNTKLLEFLIKNFTQQDDVILDPMCGSGSTGIVAALLNRNAVQVDIEKKFVDWAEEAKRKVEAQATFTLKGSIINICGDSRKLSELLKKADVVVTSPPYAEMLVNRGGNQKINQDKNRPHPYSSDQNQIGQMRYGNLDVIVTSPPYGEAQDGHGIAKEGYHRDKHSPTDLVGNRSYMPNKFESKENISRLPMGNVDTIITSPPYAECDPSQSHMTSKNRADPNDPNYRPSWKRKIEQEGYLNSKRPYDAVITSPPYAIDPKNVCHTKEGKTLEDYDKKRGFKPTVHPRVGYSPNKQNIGNLPMKVDAIITSPPYSEALSERAGGGSKKNVLGVGIVSDGKKQAQGAPIPYSEREENISNLKHGEISAIITSPPYGNRMSDAEVKDGDPQRASYALAGAKDEKNIGRLEIDAIVTSPPYEASVSDDKEGPLVGGNEKKYGRWKKGTARKHSHTQNGEPPKIDTKQDEGYGEKKETYLEAMLKCYAEMWKV